MIENCLFNGNKTADRGGAIYSSNWNGGHVDIKIKQSKFYNNIGVNGGAIFAWGGCEISNCEFINNQALAEVSHDGGGAVFAYNMDGDIINCTFVNNYTTFRGGAINLVTGSSPRVYNSIFWNNEAQQGMDTYGATLINCLIETDPLFLDIGNSDYRLSLCSPAIDVGDNAIVSTFNLTQDLLKKDRIVDGNDNNTAVVDIGAHEFMSNEMAIDGALENEGTIPTDIYQVTTTINSEGIITTGSAVTFIAGESITLNPGFYVEAGSIFSAKIEACESTDGYIENTEVISRQTLQNQLTKMDKEKVVFSVAPNPFQAETQLNFKLPKETKVAIHLFDQSGKLIQELVAPQVLAEGEHQITLTQADLQSGLFYAILQTPEQRMVQKIVLIKNQ